MEKCSVPTPTVSPDGKCMRVFPRGDRVPGIPQAPVFDGNGEGDGCGCNGDHDHIPTCQTQGQGGCVGVIGCGEGSWGLNGHPLAMVYAPCQTFYDLYDSATALHRGTLFSELDLPLGECGGRSTVGICVCNRETKDNGRRREAVCGCEERSGR